eukprot:gene639-356_t
MLTAAPLSLGCSCADRWFFYNPLLAPRRAEGRSPLSLSRLYSTTMSSHFRAPNETEKKFSWAYFLSPTRERSAMEQRFWKHAYFRSVVFLTGCLYFVYCNPEYSHTYSWIRRRMGWGPDDPPLLPQIWKIQILGVPSPSPEGGEGGRRPRQKSKPSCALRRIAASTLLCTHSTAFNTPQIEVNPSSLEGKVWHVYRIQLEAYVQGPIPALSISIYLSLSIYI